MTTLLRRNFILLLLGATTAGCLSHTRQPREPLATICGHVFQRNKRKVRLGLLSTGMTVANHPVMLQRIDLHNPDAFGKVVVAKQRTNDRGYFEFKNIQPGTYSLTTPDQSAIYIVDVRNTFTQAQTGVLVPQLYYVGMFID